MIYKGQKKYVFLKKMIYAILGPLRFKKIDRKHLNFWTRIFYLFFLFSPTYAFITSPSIEIYGSNNLDVTGSTVSIGNNLTVSVSSGLIKLSENPTVIVGSGAVSVSPSQNFTVIVGSGSINTTSAKNETVLISSGLVNVQPQQNFTVNIGTSNSVSCTNCSGGGGGNSTVIIASGVITSIQELNKSTVSIAASGTNLTATGSSLNVNCTGGCGSPTQAGSFVAYSSNTLTANRHQAVLMNLSTSTAILKITHITMENATEAAVTGIVTHFRLHRITNTAGCFDTKRMVTQFDTTDASASTGFIFCTAPTSVTAESAAMAGATFGTEEATLNYQANVELFDFRNNGGKPITLRAGQGISVKQGALTASAGNMGVSIYFTQE